jgi:biopolymer transport protein ExbD
VNFRRRSGPQLPQFQITPMIDVVFLLLSFFVSSQLFAQWETSEDIQLPTTTNAQLPDRLPGEIILNIGKDGRVVVNRMQHDETELRALLQRVKDMYPGQSVLLRADKAVPFEHVMRVLDLCRTVDIWNISFATLRAEVAP